MATHLIVLPCLGTIWVMKTKPIGIGSEMRPCCATGFISEFGICDADGHWSAAIFLKGLGLCVVMVATLDITNFFAH